MSVTSRNPLRPLAVLGGARTPFCKAFSQLQELQADALGAAAVRAALQHSGRVATDIDETVFGNVATPVHAANISRVLALKAGIPQDRPAHTVSRNCASGMESLVSGWQAINEGRAGAVVAGGTESMSNIPLQFSREFQEWMFSLQRLKGVNRIAQLAQFRPQMLQPVVALQVGLTDPTCGLNMGETAEILAEEFQISRDAQDLFALESHLRAARAWERCFMKGEVIEVSTPKGVVSKDNGVRAQQTLEALAKLRPVFRKANGTVTAGNSSQLTDGAAALVIADDEHARGQGWTRWGTIRAYAVAGLDPRRMGLGPVYAIDRLLKETGKSLGDFDLFEINEAFAAQVLACLKAMQSPEFCKDHLYRDQPIGEIPRDKLNVNGGAIALGHPLGASGTRLVLTLFRALEEQGLRHGLAALCIGGGQGMAMWIERDVE